MMSEQMKVLPRYVVQACPVNGSAEGAMVFDRGRDERFCLIDAVDGFGGGQTALARAKDIADMFNRAAAPEGPLVEFFRGDGYSKYGWHGDQMGWSPEETAAHFLREHLACPSRPTTPERLVDQWWDRARSAERTEEATIIITRQELADAMSDAALAALNDDAVRT